MKGTASFYEMFKFEPVGTYLMNICTNISCMLAGSKDLLEHAEASLGVQTGGTTDDGVFTLEDAECMAACTEAPCLQVNYRYRYRVSPEQFDSLISDLRDGRLEGEIPAHGTLARVQQSIPQEQLAGVLPPNKPKKPEWLTEDQPVAVGIPRHRSHTHLEDQTPEPHQTTAASSSATTTSTADNTTDTITATSSTPPSTSATTTSTADNTTDTTPPPTSTPTDTAAGYVDNGGVKIVSSRFGLSDSFTLRRLRGDWWLQRACIGSEPLPIRCPRPG